jgi:hypothetical protein
MNITSLAPMTEQGLTFAFDDRTMNYDRSGTINFRAPFVISIQSQLKPKADGQAARPFDINLVMIPTKPGWSRILVCGGPGASLKPTTSNDNNTSGPTKKVKPSVMARVFRVLPRWLIHVLTHRILDHDIVLLHNQEHNRVNRHVDYDGYCMPATADRCIVPIRRWVLQYAHIPSLKGGHNGGHVLLPNRPADRRMLFDHWSQHTDQCQHCHGALVGIQKYRKMTYAAIAVSVLLSKSMVSRMAFVGGLALVQIFNVLERSMKQGECEHYRNG